MTSTEEPIIPQALLGGDTFVARQPICEQNQSTFAYELLFRHADVQGPATDNVDRVNSFFDIGLHQMVGSSTAFIAVNRDFILGDHCASLPKNQVVFEIRTDTKPDLELMNSLSSLRSDGYRFAVDDFAFQDDEWPLVRHCDFVKVDVQGMARQTMNRGMARLRTFPSTMLLAKNVDRTEEFESCLEAGFQYFQGSFFCKPKTSSGGEIPLNRVSICSLLAKLQEPKISMRDIEEIVRQDLSVSYQLLRYINSAALALPRKVESIGHAVRLVGPEQIRMMASLLMLGHFDDKPQALLVTSLVRARMCELVAKRLGHRESDTFFTVGLFSALDAFLDCPMDKALKILPFADNVRNALLRYDGPSGYVLKCVLAYERGDWQTLAGLNSNSTLGHIYMEALSWSDRLVQGAVSQVTDPACSDDFVGISPNLSTTYGCVEGDDFLF